MRSHLIDFAAHPRAGIQASIRTKQALLADEALLRQIIHTGTLMIDALTNGNRILFAGHGGSAADAQPFAAEFVSRFEFDHPGLPSLSPATDTSMLTAIDNDHGDDGLVGHMLCAQVDLAMFGHLAPQKTVA